MSKTHVHICIALMTAIAGHAVGGEIDPQPGPIAPTMKSLDQIEPRVCINNLPGSATATHLITEPGSYYLTGDVFGEQGKSGIVVDLNQDGPEDVVTIDMNGFSCIGVPGSLHGIEVPDRANVRVEKFQVRQEFGPVGGTHRWGGDGINVAGADDCVISNIHSSNNDGAGYRSSGGPRFKAGADLSKKVNIANNGGGGGGGGIIVVECRSMSLDSMNIYDNMGDGVRVSITDPDNRDESISMDTVDLYGNTGDGIDITHSSGDNIRVSIRRASLDANGGDGLRYTGIGEESADISIDELYAGHNGGYGANITALSAPSIRVSITDSTFATNVLSGLRIFGDEGAQVRTVRATRCVSSGNGGSGFEIRADRGVFDTCVASENSVHGFDTTGSPNAGGATYKKGYDYYKAKSDLNVANGINGNDCVITLSACHLISNGGNGGEVTNGEARVIDSMCLDNGGSGLRSNDSPLYTESTTCGENVLYGIHASNTGDGTTVTINDTVVRSNGSGGGRVEGGTLCGNTSHFISNGGGGGGGSGNGLEVIDAASIWIMDVTANGNTGSGVAVDNSVSGISPYALTLDRVQGSGNGGHGVYSEKASFGGITNCVTNNNGGDGVHLAPASTGMRIERCVSSGNALNGYNAVGFGNILVGNSAMGNIAGAIKAIVPGNTIGIQIDEAGVATNGNPSANYVR